ncbi:MAG: ABC transporter ATP-binding protein [Prevotella sp.]|nr:ABC transporter ATP-binding protein [Prevotella sp.]
MEDIIRLENAVKEYNDGYKNTIRALDIEDLRIKNGEFLVVLGRSGSGKSTLLNVIGAQCDLTSGDTYYKEQSYKKMKDKEKATLRAEKFGYVFQSYCLVPHYTVYQNIELAMIVAGNRLSGRNKKERIKTCARQAGIENLLNKKAERLSGGEKQRCAIARAMVNDPEVILADEPTGALDLKTGDAVLELFKELNNQGKTVVIVTHNVTFTQYADRTIELSDGRIKM